jgi:hypothetical protein
LFGSNVFSSDAPFVVGSENRHGTSNPGTLELRLGSCVVLVSDSRGCALIFPVFADCFLVPGRSRVFSIDTTIVSHMSTLPVVYNNTVICQIFFLVIYFGISLPVQTCSNQFSSTNRGPARRVSQRLALLPQSSEWLPVVNSPTVETTDENITVLPVFPLSSVWLG